MADPRSLIDSITSCLRNLVDLIRTSQHSDSTRASSELREIRQRVETVLEISHQKFQVWVKTWLENVSDPDISVEKLWGEKGWSDLKILLRSVQDHAQGIEDLMAKKDNSIPVGNLRRIFRASLMKKHGILAAKRTELNDSAILLNRSIDEVWTYSEVAFDSLHGLFSHQIGPPQRERLLMKSLHARTGALGLYEACNQSKADYSLGIDLFGESSVSSKMLPGLFYHLFARIRGSSDTVHEIIVEDISRPDVKNYRHTEVVIFDVNISDLAVRQSWPALKAKSMLLFIHANENYAPASFRISKPPVALSCKGPTESLAQLLDNDGLRRTLSHETRVQLAFKVVECGFYLLGTPWLASLSSKRLRRMRPGETSPFVLEVQTLDLEDLYFEEPDALSERSQLFSIGVILAEIALGGERNPHGIKDLDLGMSEILPLVERSMGSLYCAATAFCLADRKSAPNFGRPEKYESVKESAWISYLKDLLEDYHAQVFSR